MNALQDKPEADVCVSGVAEFENEIGAPKCGPAMLPPEPQRIDKLLPRRNLFSLSAVIVRRSLMRDADGFSESQRLAEDWDCWLRLHQAGAQFICCMEVLVAYRQHANNASSNAWRMYEAEMQTYERRIAPTIHPLMRPIDRQMTRSRFLMGVALEERRNRRAYWFPAVLSILCFPFTSVQPYKVLLFQLKQIVWRRFPVKRMPRHSYSGNPSNRKNVLERFSFRCSWRNADSLRE